MRRILIVVGVSALVFSLASFGTGRLPLRVDSSRAALVSLGREYGNLQQWAAAIATDSLANAERARAIAHQLARVLGPLEQDFEKTTAALSTAQLEQILPLWERMVFAHAGFAMLQARASMLGVDPILDPSELHALADELSAVLDFAAQVQQRVLDELLPAPTSARLT